MAKKNQLPDGICAYCGTRGQMTEDHVIARRMFVPPYPSYLPVVPACRPCNEQKGEYDDYLRNILVLDLSTAGNPVARQIAEGPAARSIKRPESRIGSAMRARGQSQELFTGTGLRIATSIPRDMGRIGRGIEWIVRGLYYHERGGKRLPDDYSRYCQVKISCQGVRYCGHE